jgi:hypothetical protein
MKSSEIDFSDLFIGAVSVSVFPVLPTSGQYKVDQPVLCGNASHHWV